MHLRSAGWRMCSYGCLFACICEALAWLVYIFGVLLVDPENFSPLFVSVILRIFIMRPLGLGHSESVSVRTQIHSIWWIWQFHGGFFFFVVQKWFHCIDETNDNTMIVLCSCGIPHNNLPVMPECVRNVQHIPVTRLLGFSGFGNATSCVESDASNGNP